MTEVSRDNFSFSSKLVVGEYYDTNTSMRFTEQQIHVAIGEVRGGSYTASPYSKYRCVVGRRVAIQVTFYQLLYRNVLHTHASCIYILYTSIYST